LTVPPLACPEGCFSVFHELEFELNGHGPENVLTKTDFLRYIEAMFEVLVYVYENYWRGDACPELQRLERKLSAVGFEADEIREALNWLDGLNLAAQGTQLLDHASATTEEKVFTSAQSTQSMRIYSVAEQAHLGASCLGFISFLESSGVLPSPMREIVIDRAMAVPEDEVSLDDLKIIILMVYWSFGEEPDALILDELCDDPQERIAH
jgi:Smg protein